MNKYNVRLRFLEYITQSGKNTSGYVGEVLPLFHNVQVVIRLYIENL